MSKFFNSPVIGIDVSADFSMAAILAPNGDVYRKAFKIKHDVSGFNYLFEQIKKVEKVDLCQYFGHKKLNFNSLHYFDSE